MPPSTHALTDALEIFLKVFESGIGRLKPGAMSIFGILTALELTLAGLWWAYSGQEALGKFLKKCLLIFFLLWVVDSYSSILKWVVEGFTYAGTTAAGGGMAAKSVMEDPSAVLDKGLDQIMPILELAARLGLDWNFFDSLITLICGLVTFLAYVILALQVFITRVEFALITTLGLILLPFGVFRHTSFMADKVFGAVLSFGVKLMVLALVIEVAYPILTKYTLTEDPDWRSMLTLGALSFGFVTLALHAPSVASGLLSGNPSLGNSALGSGASFTAGTGTNAVRAAGYGAAGAVLSSGALGAAALKPLKGASTLTEPALSLGNSAASAASNTAKGLQNGFYGAKNSANSSYFGSSGLNSQEKEPSDSKKLKANLGEQYKTADKSLRANTGSQKDSPTAGVKIKRAADMQKAFVDKKVDDLRSIVSDVGSSGGAAAPSILGRDKE